MIGEIICCIYFALLLVHFSHCNIQCMARPFTSVVAFVPTPNAHHYLSCVPCVDIMYRLLPAKFPRCQSCSKDAGGVTFTTPNDDEVDESRNSEIGNGINESINPSNTNENTANIDHNNDDDTAH